MKYSLQECKNISLAYTFKNYKYDDELNNFYKFKNIITKLLFIYNFFLLGIKKNKKKYIIYRSIKSTNSEQARQ